MSNPAFIVDGQHEQKIVQKLCPGSPVRRLNCNGEQVEISAAAKRAASLIRLIGNKHYPIVIIYDREKRKESADGIRQRFLKYFKDEGITTPCIVGVPDQMIENWILGDWNNVKSKGALRGSPPSRVDGINGKALISKKMPDSCFYHKTIEGVEWLTSASPKEIYSCSPSFRRFADDITGLHCKWLECVTKGKEKK